MRRSALASLGEIGDARAVEPLVGTLTERGEHLQVRLAALSALRRIGDVSAVPRLRQALTDTGDAGELRAAVAEALADALPPRGAAALLLRLLGDPDRLVRRAAPERLEQMDEGALARAVFRSLDGDRAAMAQLRDLADGGDARGLRPLLERLDDRDEAVLRAAAQTLVVLGPEHATEALVRRLGDPGPRRRTTAARVLAAIGEERLAFAAVNSMQGRGEALELLREMVAEGDWRAAHPLAMRLGAEADTGGTAACVALKAMGSASIPALTPALAAEPGDRGPWGIVGSEEHNRAMQLLSAGVAGASPSEHRSRLAAVLRQSLPHWQRLTGTFFKLPSQLRDPLRELIESSRRLAV